MELIIDDLIMETKVCTCCGEELPSTEEYFFKDKHCRDGLLGQCKKCIRVKRLKYNGDHPEKIIASTKKYKTENKDKIKISGKKYRLENVDRENERSRKYKIDMKNDPHFKARRVLDSELRRARKLLLPATFTMEEWEETKIYFDNKCAYCDRELPLEQDHFIPLNSKGGYVKENIVPACKTCNCSKNDNDFLQWYRKYEYYSKEREERVIEYLNLIKEDDQQKSLAI